MTVFFIIIALIILAVATWSVFTERRLNRQIEQIQLQAHKELFAHQIWQSRRSFRRNMRRQHKETSYWLNASIAFCVVAVIALAAAIFLQLSPMPLDLSQAAIIKWFFVGENHLRNVFLWVAFGFGLLAAVVWAISEKLIVNIEIANHGDTDRIVFWEPDVVSRQRLHLHLLDAGLVAVSVFVLALAGSTGTLPDTPSGVGVIKSAMGTSNVMDNSGAAVSSSSTSSADTASTDSSAADSATTASTSSDADSATTGSTSGEAPSSKEASTSDVFAATPLKANVVAKVSEADWAAMFYMAYYSFLGKDAYSLFSGSAANIPTYVQVVHNGNNTFFVYSEMSNGQRYYNTYAYMDKSAGQVTFYNLTNVSGNYKKLTDMVSMQLNKGVLTPSGEGSSDTIDVAQIAGAYYQQSGMKKSGFDRVKANLRTGPALAAY